MPPKLKKSDSGSNQRDHKQETGGGEQGGLSTAIAVVGIAGVAAATGFYVYKALKK